MPKRRSLPRNARHVTTIVAGDVRLMSDDELVELLGALDSEYRQAVRDGNHRRRVHLLAHERMTYSEMDRRAYWANGPQI